MKQVHLLENHMLLYLAINKSWFIVSKAFDKSMNMAQTKPPLSRVFFHFSSVLFKQCFVNNTNINEGKLNNSGLHFNECGTTRLANNFCLSLAEWRYFICVDTVVTKKNDFNNPPNVTKILKPFSSRKSADRPSVD